MPYLDVLINNDNNVDFKLQEYLKSINNGLVMNWRGECPKQYIESVINSFIIRANKIFNTEEQFHNEIDYIKKVLNINNYNPKLMQESIENS